jgi:hypothetical protein
MTITSPRCLPIGATKLRILMHMHILVSVIRGPGHPDKSMYKWIETKDAGYDHREGHDYDLTYYDRADILRVRGT